MKNFAFWALIGLNGLLLGTFGSRMWKDNAAVAQANNRDDYLMIPGDVLTGVNSVVYVIDETTHQLSAMSYDDSNKSLKIMPPRDMVRDFDSMPGQGRRR